MDEYLNEIKFNVYIYITYHCSILLRKYLHLHELTIKNKINLI